MTLEEGVHPEIPVKDYFADPAPRPSLNQSTAKILVESCPRKAWEQHPRLNPDFATDDEYKFDLANVAHRVITGRGRDVVPLEFADWRKAEAKQMRAQALANGAMPILTHQVARVDRMVDAANHELNLRDLPFFHRGAGEVVLIWREGDVWLRQLVDWYDPEFPAVIDYKTTELSLAEGNLPRIIANAGWHIQAAMSERALEVLVPGKKFRFFFFAQEVEPPHLAQVVEMTADWLILGRKILDAAVSIWRTCMVANRWPGYALSIQTPPIPGWYEQMWLEREIHEAAQQRMPRKGEVPSDILGAG